MVRKFLIAVLISASLAIVAVETARLSLPFPPLTFAASKSFGNVVVLYVLEGSTMVSLCASFQPIQTSHASQEVRFQSGLIGFRLTILSNPIGIWMRFPLLFASAMLMFYPILTLTRIPIRRRWRRRHGRCESCCYSLRGLTETRCPECGTSTLPDTSANWTWRRRGVVAVGAVVMVIVVALGLRLVYRRYANSPWETYYEQLRSAGEPLTLQEIEARRPTIADHENGTLLILQLANELGSEAFETTEPVLLVRKDSGADEPFAWAPRSEVESAGLKTDLRKYDLFVGIPHSTLEPTRRFLRDRTALPGELARLEDMPAGRLPIENDPLVSPLDVMLPSLRPWKNAATLERLNVLIRLLDGDVAGALEATRSQFRIAATLADESSVISRTVERYCIGQGIRSLELILRSTELNEATCSEFSALLTCQLAKSSWKTPLLFERACTIELFNRLAAGEPLSSDGAPFATPDRAYPMLYQIRRAQIEATQMWTKLIEVIGAPVEAVAQATQFDDRKWKGSSFVLGSDEMLREFTPGFAVLIRGMASNVVHLRAAKAALACERFRLMHGRWPEALADLVPEFLPEVSMDALGDGPIRMRKVVDVLCIYSVGTNGADDDCNLDTPEGKFHPLDIGFRLVDPGKRGLAILEDEATSDP